MAIEITKQKTDLISLSLHRDMEDDTYYLSAIYRVEDERSVREVTIPKIHLPIKRDRCQIRHIHDVHDVWPYPELDIGFGYLPLKYAERDGEKIYFTETVIEEKTHEMTLDEIEKKLGYKVKIVNK